ncbi:MAG: hypothetical protein NC548_39930 [Lachnospiraceae bacterium]|nr:hypothetical protein [Lachnospiraceae bacterium]
MVRNEKELARAIMRHDSRIELSDNLASAVDKIKEPSAVVWKSVAAVFVASTFFWAGGPAIALGMMVGLPAVLAVCGGVGGVVFVTLGGNGTLCAFKLLITSQTMDVLTMLREKYELENNILTLK